MQITRKAVQVLLLGFLLVSTVHAERYLGDIREAKPITTFQKNLRQQYESLQKLMDMLGRLEKWKAKLNKENNRLAEEDQLAKQDRKKHEAGKMTDEQMHRKWHASGRSLKHDRELKEFKQEVARFNQYVREYNKMTRKLKPVLDKRSPRDVSKLIHELRKLDGLLQEALDTGNIEKAKFIAKRSKYASEFGYKEQ